MEVRGWRHAPTALLWESSCPFLVEVWPPYAYIFGTRWRCAVGVTPRPLYFEKAASSIHWLGGRLGPTAGHNAAEKRKICCLCQQSYSVVVQLNYLAFCTLHSYSWMPSASNLNCSSSRHNSYIISIGRAEATPGTMELIHSLFAYISTLSLSLLLLFYLLFLCWLPFGQNREWCEFDEAPAEMRGKVCGRHTNAVLWSCANEMKHWRFNKRHQEQRTTWVISETACCKHTLAFYTTLCFVPDYFNRRCAY
jgi:hypothetical protein